MITLNKLTYDLLELIRGNITDDDELALLTERNALKTIVVKV